MRQFPRFCRIPLCAPVLKLRDDELVVFHDRSPASRVHLLLVPKRHIDNVKTLLPEDAALLQRMRKTGQEVLERVGVPLSEQRFYSVNHLHLHLLSLPLPFRGSLKYRPALPSEAERSSGKLKGWSWFVEVDQVLDILRAGQKVKVASVRAPTAAA
ncbi:Histidine triad nucleotide-binding protein 3 [Rhodotorula toruloides]|nr:Histidine triad nucleotide-binding protein 3 [Rhodotorula toruloides]